MQKLTVKSLTALSALSLALLATGCEDGNQNRIGKDQPAQGRKSDDQNAATELGFPLFATKNTTRVGGGDATADAAAIARAVYPGGARSQRPKAIALVPQESWQTALAATQLIGAPLQIPVLFGAKDEIPSASAEAIKQLQPRGLKKRDLTQLLGIGGVKLPSGYRSKTIAGTSPADTALAIDRFRVIASGQRSNTVVVVSQENIDFAVPAAGWAAKSGDAILFVGRDSIPQATKTALLARDRPHIYVLGPKQIISKAVLKKLKKFGAVTRIQGKDPVTNAIEFARFEDGAFGWGVNDPGHGLNFISQQRPLDAIAAAPLAASGSYGPLLMLSSVGEIPSNLKSYLLDIQPGYESDPVRGVYNRGWIVGDQKAISLTVQQQLDALLEIVPVTNEAKK